MAIKSKREIERKTEAWVKSKKEDLDRILHFVKTNKNGMGYEQAMTAIQSIASNAYDLAQSFRQWANDDRQGKLEESVKSSRKSFKQYLTEAVLPTENEGWGFFGTGNAHNNYEQMKVFWDYTSKELAKKLLWSPKQVRWFLDSRGGRHFADSITDLGPWSFRHIDKAIQDWQSKDWFNSWKE